MTWGRVNRRGDFAICSWPPSVYKNFFLSSLHNAMFNFIFTLVSFISFLRSALYVFVSVFLDSLPPFLS